MLPCLISWFLFPNWLPHVACVFNALNNHTSVIWFYSHNYGLSKAIKTELLSNTLKGFFHPLCSGISDQVSGIGILHIYTYIQDMYLYLSIYM